MTNNTFEILRTQVYTDIIRCAYNAYNYFHWGVDELVYEAGLMSEIDDKGYEVLRQQEFPIYYKGRSTAVNRKMDLVVRDKNIGFVILELKALDHVGDMQRQQLWSYMKLTNIKHGCLINFSPKGVYFENWMLGESVTDKCVRF